MAVIYGGALNIYVKKVLNTALQLYLSQVSSFKKREDKPYQYQSIQRFFSEYTYMKHIPDSLQLSQKQAKLNTYTDQKLLQTSFFTLHSYAFF